MKHFHKKLRNPSGFTLVEMIAYVAIFAVAITIILQLFWRVQTAGERARIAGEVKENASQAMQLITSKIRQADSIDTVSSVFGSHPGTLVINDTQTITIDTYTKSVTVGDQSVTIRKLRLTEGTNPAVDLTSDHVDVGNFVLTNLTPTDAPNTVQSEITLSKINPDGYVDFESSLSLRSTAGVRQES